MPSGREVEIGARLTVNATGTALDRLLAPLGQQARSGRNRFVVPWRGRALFGTWEFATACDPDATRVSEAEIATFIAHLNHAFPSLDLAIADVTLVHGGVVPTVTLRDGTVTLERHEPISDFPCACGIEGIVSLSGTKYTTVRFVAERITDRALATLHEAAAACRTATTALPGGCVGDHAGGLPSETIPHLLATYGSRYRDVVEIAADRPAWRSRVALDSPVIGAELVWAVRKEMTVTLKDAAGCRSAPSVTRVLPSLHGRPVSSVQSSAGRQREEITGLRALYSW